jgi:hypothetical protein
VRCFPIIITAHPGHGGHQGVRHRDPLTAVLVGLTVNGITYDWTATPRFYVAERCPSCGFEDFWLYGEGDDVYLACWAGCPPTAIIRALTHGAPNGRARSDLAAVCVQDVPYDPYLVP